MKFQNHGYEDFSLYHNFLSKTLHLPYIFTSLVPGSKPSIPVFTWTNPSSDKAEYVSDVSSGYVLYRPHPAHGYNRLY